MVDASVRPEETFVHSVFLRHAVTVAPRDTVQTSWSHYKPRESVFSCLKLFYVTSPSSRQVHVDIFRVKGVRSRGRGQKPVALRACGVARRTPDPGAVKL